MLFKIVHIYYMNHFCSYFRENVDNISFASVASTMCKYRAQAVPKNPQSVQEVNDLFATPNVLQNYGMTLRYAPTNDDEPKVAPSIFFRTAYECDEYGFCIFAAKDTIDTIVEKTQNLGRKTIFADGTFKICPVGKYNQVLIMFIDLFGYVSKLSLII